MEFDFLPQLPKSNLDDRAYQDLVDECLLRIPRYCPEWTHFNPSDPGVTLIELFAWLTDQMFARFNQVPRRNYVSFLELLGIRLQAPAPAQTDITFYLSTILPEPYTIPMDTEVATIRTETEEAIVFSSDRPLTIDQPQLRHCLTSITPESLLFQDQFAAAWGLNPNHEWEGPNLEVFSNPPQPGNSFYLVFDSAQQIEGNVIALKLRGDAATPTGINPERPPRRWEAWNGSEWVSVLWKESDDRTDGFSFATLTRQGGNAIEGADVILHLPQSWPVSTFSIYQGRWVRCVYTEGQEGQQPGYARSPRLIGMQTRSIGGTVGITQSEMIRNDVLGESDGTPGQKFQLQRSPILPRRPGEGLLITPPGGLPQAWSEVSDFADSGAEDLHYTLDDQTGEIQFGPLIREPTQIKNETLLRDRLQRGQSFDGFEGPLQGRSRTLSPVESGKRQYGKVPVIGSEIRMAAYRTGGGLQGNVRPGAIRILKSAIPYVASLTNYRPGLNGTDAETLDAAAMRVPKLLRTRDRAVTQEDFETLTLLAGEGAIARVLCRSSERHQRAGLVQLLLVPQMNTELTDQGEGIHPEQLSLNPQLLARVNDYLEERSLLGVKIDYRQPDYIGVSVQAEVSLEKAYDHPEARATVSHTIHRALYRFLNPLTGGEEGKGWPFGRPLSLSDILNLLKTVPGVQYIGTVQLFELRHQGNTWRRDLPKNPIIDPGPEGLLCSWHDNALRASHTISFL